MRFFFSDVAVDPHKPGLSVNEAQRSSESQKAATVWSLNNDVITGVDL